MNESLSKYKNLLSNKEFKYLYKSLTESGRKLTSASKFLDFFVHDILDYTMLNKDETEFLKKIECFNIREAVDEILIIQNDKVKMKDIQVSTQYLGFE